MDLDDAKELNFDYAWNVFVLNDEKFNKDELSKLYETVTTNDIQTAANEIFLEKNMIINVRKNSSIYKRKQLKQLLIELRNSL